MPVGPYATFDACVADQRKKGKSEDSARRICGAVEANMTKVLILEKSDERRYTLGVVYEPNVLDTQNEFAKAEDIESAAWSFLERLQVFAKCGAQILKASLTADATGVQLDVDEAVDVLEKSVGLDDQHLQVSDDLGTIVESYIAPQDLVINGQAIKKGAWLLGVRWSPEMFAKIKSGERTGLSMFGRADRMGA